MSKDLSMFKKMKERITDEVNSATNKLQNMQIMDQLASTINQQIKNELTTPNFLLPEQPHISTSATTIAPDVSDNNRFSLMDHDNTILVSGYEDDELDSEISPQHQLFHENSIRRLQETTSISNGTSAHKKDETPVINIDELSSDIEDGFNENLAFSQSDVEIDLLSNETVLESNVSSKEDAKNFHSSEQYQYFRNKYKTIIHALRNLSKQFKFEQSQLEIQKTELINQITALKIELDNSRQQQQQHDSLISVSTNISENDKTSTGSPQLASKTSTKLKDLEKLLSKCKESLKLKNAQIKTLKDSLSKVEEFKDLNHDLRNELQELRKAHETWTVSIAENKRVMHQEIESKNFEMEKLKTEIKELQSKLNDNNIKARHLKSCIQDLESRLVNTSAAHQKERESLTKELTMAKNLAVKQLQMEHEHHLERVKLDLEKSIEALKLEILHKDEQIIRSATQQQQLQDKNQSLIREINEHKSKLEEKLKLIEKSELDHAELLEKYSALETELESTRARCNNDREIESKNNDLTQQVSSLEKDVSSLNDINLGLMEKLKEFDSDATKVCNQCQIYKEQMEKSAEDSNQELHELNSRLALMTTANEDQEKEIANIKSERDKLDIALKTLQADINELNKKNETLTGIIRENEIDIESHRRELDQMNILKTNLNAMRVENSQLVENLSQCKYETNEVKAELLKLKQQNAELNEVVSRLKESCDLAKNTSNELAKEKHELLSINDHLSKQIDELNEQFVIKIISTMKNLDTPNTSPGSDKSYESNHNQGISEQNEQQVDRNEMPNALNLMDKLSSLALERCAAYVTATQRLQAVLLHNNGILEEIKRLKAELDSTKKARELEAQSDLEEIDRLLSENQRLLEKQRLIETQPEPEPELEEKEIEPIVPDSTQFEYLKNIVLQFMLGKQPLVLARVISAVFNFDKSQIEQICKVQEVVQVALGQ